MGLGSALWQEALVWFGQDPSRDAISHKGGQCQTMVLIYLLWCWRYVSDTEFRGSVVMFGSQHSEGGWASAGRGGVPKATLTYPCGKKYVRHCYESGMNCFGLVLK